MAFVQGAVVGAATGCGIILLVLVAALWALYKISQHQDDNDDRH